MKINKSNYEFYKKVFKVIWEFQAPYYGMNSYSPTSPINVLESWEKENESIARRGLKEGLRDSLTGLNHFTDESKIELNESLISENLPSLNILTSQIKNVPKRVLKNGKIKNINEYYIIKEILCDLEYEITESERNELNSLYEEYEFGK
ncbi:hypothetical protein [Polaribacter sp. Hel1_85]|uniref:hypothetical protein n=1 Tax=Polaribacter sp. Hel1_85 TaxID=1250005 RepID=UPI00052B909A|nr:hypothetical protein [Polaribacter sp. Hel1_85]KGL59075.1 hypothetical protein PHEL85_3349 [Polaribacter sp. Hel1_85]